MPEPGTKGLLGHGFFVVSRTKPFAKTKVAIRPVGTALEELGSRILTILIGCKPLGREFSPSFHPM